MAGSSGHDPLWWAKVGRAICQYQHSDPDSVAECVAYHDELIENSPTPQFEPDEFRHLFTTRLTYRAMMDKLIWSLFVFWSPSDSDYYLRPKVTYRYSDRWTVVGGMSLFGGNDEHTFFGQLDDNSNAYVRVRYNY